VTDEAHGLAQLECRSEEAVGDQFGNNACNPDLEADRPPRRPILDRVEELAPELLPDKSARIVVYCASGPCQNSEIATLKLGKLGYTNVADYHEGKAEWIAAGLPVERSAAAA
jgi:rhodanese-related sulfurtransferase